MAYESLDAACSVPPYNVRGNLIGDRVAQNSGMTSRSTRASDYLVLNIQDGLGIVEKGEVPLPLQSHQNTQSMLLRKVQQPSGRSVVSSDGIYAMRRHETEVALHPRWRRVRIAGGVRLKRPVGHAPHIKFLLTNPEEFASYLGTDPIVNRRFWCWLSSEARCKSEVFRTHVVLHKPPKSRTVRLRASLFSRRNDPGKNLGEPLP